MTGFMSGVSNRGYFITGDPGCGKTFWTCILAKELYLKGKNVHYFDAGDLKLKFLDSVMEKNRKNLIEWIVGLDYLFINDIGSEKSGQGFEEFLFTIIDKREQKMNNKIVITSNLGLDEIATRVHDRIPSRISGMCGDPRIFQSIDWRGSESAYDPNKSEPLKEEVVKPVERGELSQEDIRTCFDNLKKLGCNDVIVRLFTDTWKECLMKEQKEYLKQIQNKG